MRKIHPFKSVVDKVRKINIFLESKVTLFSYNYNFADFPKMGLLGGYINMFKGKDPLSVTLL